MASPPFNINQALPGDNDIVSQHPSNARTMRDVVESWLLVNHNVQGRHNAVGMDYLATPTGVASVAYIWASTLGRLFTRKGTAAIEYVQVPPGTVIDYAGASLPEGYLACDGSAVSRTTYDELFTAISTIYGAGNGTTTFNLPDLRGRVVAGQDDMGGVSADRLTNFAGGLNGDTLGATGGLQNHVILQASLPNVNFKTPLDWTHQHFVLKDISANNTITTSNYTAKAHDDGSPDSYALKGSNQAADIGLSSEEGEDKTGANAINTPSGGSGTAINIVQPTMILNKLIKT